MKHLSIHKPLMNSMFIGLMASFLLIIILSSIFYLISYNFFIENIENEIVKNASHSIEFKKNKMDEKLYQLKNMFLNISSDSAFTPVINGQQTPHIQNKIVLAFLEKYRSSNEHILKYVERIFVLPEDYYNNILLLDSTINCDRFFEAFFKSSTYTKNFWLEEMKKEFIFNLYPTGIFQDSTYYSYEREHNYILMPMAYKRNNNSSFIIIALININALYGSIDQYDDNFYIYNSNNELLFPAEQDESFNFLDIDHSSQFVKTKNGYLFSRKSNEGDLIYSAFLPNNTLKQQLNKTNSTFRLIAVLSFIISILLSFAFVKIFNDPVKQIADLIKRSSDNTRLGNFTSLSYIRDSVRLIVEDNEAKNSMLESFSFQSGLKGSYLPFNDLKKKFTFNNFMLICFVIHYKDKYRDEFMANTGKGAFVLKELIELYLSDYFQDSITFQIESEKIISIVNIKNNTKDITSTIEEVGARLKYEEEYVFFTIITSNIYNDTSQLNKTYNGLFEISKYRKLINSTQILFENSIKSVNNRYYLSSEQTERLSNLLSGGQQDECIQCVNDILQYNYKKEVIQFSFQLLCTEIINCGAKVLTKLYYEVPECIDINGIYSRINSYSSFDEFVDSCNGFVISVTNYINSHSKASDYIIDYITDYIENHYPEEIYLDLLAQKLGITSNYISSYFRDKVGTNFNYYLNNFRIKKSINLLSNSSFKIKDISEKVGYTNVNTFTRAFKKHFGKTPDEYRKNLI